MNHWAGYTVKAIIHAPNSGFTGPFTSAPASYVDGSGTPNAYATTSGGINHYTKSGSTWTGEVVTSGSFTSGLAAYVSSSTNNVFVETSGGINHYAKSTGTWGGEVAASGTFTNNPSAFTDSSGTLHVFATTSGGINHYSKPSGGSWSGEVVSTETPP